MNKNVLEISGVSVEQLAATCKTPLYVYDENKIRQQLSMYHELFQSKDFDTEVLYASKAFSCKAMVELVKTYGLSLDVVSGGELFTAYFQWNVFISMEIINHMKNWKWQLNMV